MGDPTKHLRRAGEKQLADYFIDTALSGAAGLFRDFVTDVIRVFKGAPLESLKPEIIKAFELYGQAVQADEPFADVLGSVYMAIASRGGRSMLGQFFSPSPLADLKARMLGLSHDTLNPNDLTRIGDPACGSGALLLAVARIVLQDLGPAALNRIHLDGTDLDSICARVAAVQIVSNVNLHRFDLGGVEIRHGDSLRLETYEVILSATSLHPWQPPAKR